MATDHAHVEEESPEIHFEPIIQLPAVEVATLEEEEEVLIQMRAKLYRFDNTLTPPEWKERGTGTVKLLKHKTSNLVRVLMRRDKTLKLCANHYVQPEMELTPNCGSDKAWVWTTPADYSDDEAKAELLAIRFANAENAQKWKNKFVEAQKIMKEAIPIHNATIDTETKNAKKTDETKTDDAKTDDTQIGKDGDGDKKVSKDKAESEKEADSVTEKLENLTVKEASNKDNTNTETDASNKTDDDKEKEKQ